MLRSSGSRACVCPGRGRHAGADGVDYSPEAEEKIETYTRLGYTELPICMAKTHLSFSADPKLKGAPTVRTGLLTLLIVVAVSTAKGSPNTRETETNLCP